MKSDAAFVFHSQIMWLDVKACWWDTMKMKSLHCIEATNHQRITWSESRKQNLRANRSVLWKNILHLVSIPVVNLRLIALDSIHCLLFHGLEAPKKEAMDIVSTTPRCYLVSWGKLADVSIYFQILKVWTKFDKKSTKVHCRLLNKKLLSNGAMSGWLGLLNFDLSWGGFHGRNTLRNSKPKMVLFNFSQTQSSDLCYISYVKLDS